jgi:cytochrome c oxidase cbb3-type subunit III
VHTMRLPMVLFFALVLTIAAANACSYPPGRPAREAVVLPPEKNLNFDSLYGQNCAGCHGEGGSGGGAMALANGVYLAIANDDIIRRITAEGVPGTTMPAFAQKSGGMLTDAQINAIVAGIRQRGNKADFVGSAPPSYAATAPGDAIHGAEVYNTFCLSCHGPAGRGGSRASSIVDSAFLALVSDQFLRTVVIAGRPELGAPDWRRNVPGKPMSEQDVSDAVAWLSAQRPTFPSQSVSTATSGTGATP